MYSQYEEERFILESLEGVGPSQLLDIGAWHAETFSNTRELIKRGWGGLLFEPSPGPVKGLCEFYADRGDIEVIAAPVTIHGGPVRMILTDDAVTMPLDQTERVKEWASTAKFYGRLTCMSMSVADILRMYGGAFEMVNIDVEGTSVDIFSQLVRLGPRPRCVVVEHDARHVELAQIAESADYQQVHLNGTNVVLRWKGIRE